MDVRLRLRFAIVLASSLASFLSGTWADTLVRQDGQRLDWPLPHFADGQFHGPDGQLLDRHQVVDWWPAASGDNQAPAQAASPSDTASAIATLAALRQRGQALADRHPGVAAVHILDDGQYTLTADHRHLFRYHFACLVLDESQMNWSSITLPFTEGRSRATIVMGRCLTADDRLFELDPNTARTASPSRGEVNFDPKSRLLSATIPGVEVGTIVEAIYEFEVYAPEDWRLFFPRFYFQSDIPVGLATYCVRVPEEVKLYHWTVNWRLGRPFDDHPSWWRRLARRLTPSPVSHRRIRLADGALYRQYQWQKRDLPPIVAEPSMPPRWQVVPAVHGTILPDWRHLDQLTGGMQRERLQVTPAIQQLANQLAGELTSDADKVATLYHWVQKNIRYISIKASLSSGWAGHPAQETLDHGYGDCTDVSVLFCTLLRAVGIEAEPLVLLTNDQGLFAPPYPILQANHCIAEVHLDGRSIILDCTSQDYRFPAFRGDNHGAFAINFIRGTRQMTPVPPGLEAHGKITSERLILNRDGALLGQVAANYAGDYEAGLRAGWKRIPEAVRLPVMQQYLSTLAPGAQLLDFELGTAEDLETPFTLNFHYRLPRYLHPAGPYRLLQLPDREITFPELSLEHRRYPLEYRTSEATKRQIDLELPPDWQPAELPPDTHIDNRFFTYRETFAWQDGKVRVQTLFARHLRRISPADYPAFRHTAKHIENVTRKPLYLHAAPTPAPAPPTASHPLP